MLSVLVLLSHSDDPPASLGALVRTLGALVPGTIEGLVRDVAILAVGPDAEVERVADHAGCALVGGTSFSDALAAALPRLRGPSAFLLRAGADVDRAFRDEAARALLENPAVPIVLREAPSGMLGRALPGLTPVAGVITPVAALRPARDFAALVKRLGKTRTLVARAAMVG